MKIAVDIDGTITAYPDFFKLFTKAMTEIGCEIHVLTDREPGTEKGVAEELENYGITYHKIKITGNKADYIMDESIEVVFDDIDEYFLSLPKGVAVFKVREKYNFDFTEKKWLYSEETGRKVGKWGSE